MTQREVRTATEDDLDRLVAIHTAAFPDPRGVPARRRNFTTNPLGTLDDLHVAVEGGNIVGHAFLFKLGVFFGGRVVPTGGIASVGVAPEARGQGVATFLIERLHAISAQRGDAITMLHAFRHAFYERFGYARAGTHKRLTLDPRSIPRAWARPARSATRSDRAALIRLYQGVACRATGWLDRPVALYDHLWLDERVQTLVMERDGELLGSVSFEYAQEEPHAETRLVVRDLVASDPDTQRALVGLLGAQSGQCRTVVIEVDAADPLDLVLGDVDGHRSGTAQVEHTFGVIVGGPMVRVLDVPRALEARGWPTDGTVDLAVDGVSYRVRASGGRAKVERGGSGIPLSSRVLAAVAFGSLRLTQAADMGLLEVDPMTAAEADRLLRLPPFFSRDSF